MVAQRTSGEHFFSGQGFSTESLLLNGDTQRFLETPTALQSMNLLSVNVSFKYILYFFFDELLFLFMFFS